MASTSMNMSSGTFRYPSCVAADMALSILRPNTATLRPFVTALSTICCILWMLDANVAMMMRLPSALANSRSKVSPTLRSEGVWPGRSALVESAIRASTPLLPSSPKRARSMISPSMGVKSTLKSPVCTRTPAGVCMASPTESGMEWFTLMNSTAMQPSFTVCPGVILLRSESGRPCSFSLPSMSAMVRAVAYTGIRSLMSR